MESTRQQAIYRFTFSDKLFSALGCGARLPADDTVSDMFHLVNNPTIGRYIFIQNFRDNPTCRGVDELLDAYVTAADRVRPATHFRFSHIVKNIARCGCLMISQLMILFKNSRICHQWWWLLCAIAVDDGCDRRYARNNCGNRRCITNANVDYHNRHRWQWQTRWATIRRNASTRCRSKAIGDRWTTRRSRYCSGREVPTCGFAFNIAFTVCCIRSIYRNRSCAERARRAGVSCRGALRVASTTHLVDAYATDTSAYAGVDIEWSVAYFCVGAGLHNKGYCNHVNRGERNTIQKRVVGHHSNQVNDFNNWILFGGINYM